MANNTSPSTVKDNSLTSTFTDHIFRFQLVSERFAYRQLRMINKAAGSDMIPAGLLKDSAAVTARRAPSRT